METINLDIYKKESVDTFTLGWLKYNYSIKKEDKILFYETIKNIKENQNIIEILKWLFRKILSKQNQIVVIIKEDIYSLLHYFTFKFT
jgi:hypothetical protein